MLSIVMGYFLIQTVFIYLLGFRVSYSLLLIITVNLMGWLMILYLSIALNLLYLFYWLYSFYLVLLKKPDYLKVILLAKEINRQDEFIFVNFLFLLFFTDLHPRATLNLLAIIQEYLQVYLFKGSSLFSIHSPTILAYHCWIVILFIHLGGIFMIIYLNLILFF